MRKSWRWERHVGVKGLMVEPHQTDITRQERCSVFLSGVAGRPHCASLHSPSTDWTFKSQKRFVGGGWPKVGNENQWSGLYLSKTKTDGFNFSFHDMRTNLFLDTAKTLIKMGWSPPVPEFNIFQTTLWCTLGQQMSRPFEVIITGCGLAGIHNYE